VKKKVAALVCAVVMLLTLLPVPAGAAETVYFTSVNETISELSDATMPFWSGGYLYVASTMFSTRELGLYYSDNTAKQKVTLYTNSRALIFDLSNGTVMDGQNNDYYPGAIVRGSVKFLPVSMIAGFFGLTYTNRKVEHGYLVRVRSSASVLSDAALLDAGASLMAIRYSDYIRGKEAPSGSGSTTGSGGVTADTPETTRQQIELCFRADDAQLTAKLLDALDSYRAGATFYVTERLIRENGDLVRRITASGYSLGLCVDAALEVPVSDQLRTANAALWDAAGCKTRLCMIEGGKDADRLQAEKTGYCCLIPGIDRSAYGLRSISNANYLLTRVNTRGGTVSVWLSDAVNVAGLKAFVSAAKTAGDRFYGKTELK
jgi:hypothetical protein